MDAEIKIFPTLDRRETVMRERQEKAISGWWHSCEVLGLRVNLFKGLSCRYCGKGEEVIDGL